MHLYSLCQTRLTLKTHTWCLKQKQKKKQPYERQGVYAVP